MEAAGLRGAEAQGRIKPSTKPQDRRFSGEFLSFQVFQEGQLRGVLGFVLFFTQWDNNKEISLATSLPLSAG